MRRRIEEYQRRLGEAFRSSYRTENKKKKEAARVIVKSASLGINSTTGDLELCVTGALEERNGKRIEVAYKIGIAMWNYSATVPECIEQKTYEEVMKKERTMLFAKYILAYVTLSHKEPVTINETEYRRQEIRWRTVDAHPVVRELIDYQAGVYGKMLTRQSEIEVERRKAPNKGIDPVIKEAERRQPLEI